MSDMVKAASHSAFSVLVSDVTEQILHRLSSGVDLCAPMQQSQVLTSGATEHANLPKCNIDTAEAQLAQLAIRTTGYFLSKCCSTLINNFSLLSEI